MKRIIHSTVLAILLTMLAVNIVHAQAYSFRIDQEIVEVFWNEDGTMSLEYTWDFVNEPGAHEIDFIDVGMPNPNFDITTVKADLNGNPVSVSKSDYQGSGSGFAVVMGAEVIAAGDNGKVHVYVGKIDKVLYNDTKDDGYASAVFVPTYFGSQFVNGETNLTVIFHLPPDIKPEEPRWHNAPSGFPEQPQTALDSEGRIIYTWQNVTANSYTEYLFGASFPTAYVPPNSIITPTPAPTKRPISTAQTTYSSAKDDISGAICFGALILGIIGIPVFNIVEKQRRKLPYLPPRIAIEGHGIKRGLTAVEAAILMEKPLDKILSMILFGVIKKGAVQIIKNDPLTIKTIKPRPDELHKYEIQFINAFEDETSEIFEWKKDENRRTKLKVMFAKLVGTVSEKMRGFSRTDTIDYYRDIVRKAWQQVEEAETPEIKSQRFDENLEWTLLDKNYDQLSRRIFTEQIFIPNWWDRYDPEWKPESKQANASFPISQQDNLPVAKKHSSPSLPSSSQSKQISPPKLPGADFAASIAKSAQNISQKIIGNIIPFTNQVSSVTNPPHPPPSDSFLLPSIKPGTDKDDSSDSLFGDWSSGGGNSCACACACAGCACACAGGGR